MQEVALIDFKHSLDADGLLRHDGLEGSVTPPNGRGNGYATFSGGLPHRQPLTHAIGVLREPLLHSQPRQRCFCDSAANAPAVVAAVALQAVRPAVSHYRKAPVNGGPGFPVNRIQAQTRPVVTVRKTSEPGSEKHLAQR